MQGDPEKGQRAWHIREKETFAIVATLYKFRSWLAGQQVRVKVLTDHKSLETWTKEDFDTVSGPIGRRGRWHQFLVNFQLDIIYVKGEDQTVPDVMSRWAYRPRMQPQMCASWEVRQMSRDGKRTTGRNGNGLILRWPAHPDRTDEDASQFVGKGNERVEEYIHTHGLRKWFHK